MPCDYSKYPANWKTEIRPAILERDGHKCKFCGVPNKLAIFRGILDGLEVYQTGTGDVFKADDSTYLLNEFDGRVQPLHGDPEQQAILVVLTIAHLDHDTQNNDPANLAALCQRCHNRHDRAHRTSNVKKSTAKKKGLQDLFKTS